MNSAKDVPCIWGAVIAAGIHMYSKGDRGLILKFKFGTCDVLLIDEAGQVPAYDAAALSHLAPRMILFGDEDQLPNICHGQHPPGSHGDSSAMAYIRDVLPDCSFSLEVSHRMNADICGLIKRHFYYPDIDLQPGKNADARLLENGTRFPSLIKHDFPHPHPRLSRSEKEAAQVVEWVQRLLKMQAVVEDGPARPLTTADIAILTPFRAHAAAIKAALAKAGVTGIERIGTVEKMQGQGAAAVIYSLASSSKDYIAGQTEWLLSSNRWNVALSRAMACAIVVGDLNAHFDAVSKALDGIAAQQKIREVLEDEVWTVFSSASSPAAPVPAPSSPPPPASKPVPPALPTKQSIPLGGNRSLHVIPHEASQVAFLELRERRHQSVITRAKLAVPFVEWPLLVAQLAAINCSAPAPLGTASVQISVENGAFSLSSRNPVPGDRGPSTPLEIPLPEIPSCIAAFSQTT